MGKEIPEMDLVGGNHVKKLSCLIKRGKIAANLAAGVTLILEQTQLLCCSIILQYEKSGAS